MKTIIFDLDSTLNDIHEHFHKIFKDYYQIDLGPDYKAPKNFPLLLNKYMRLLRNTIY